MAWNILQVIGVNGTANPTNQLFQVPNGATTQIVYSGTTQWYTVNQLLTNAVVIAAASNRVAYTQKDPGAGTYSNNVTFYRPTWSVANTFGAHSASYTMAP